MIAKFFNKSKPVNTVIELVLVAIVFILTFFRQDYAPIETSSLFQRFFMLVVLLVSLFFVNFIVRKNNLTKKNSYVLLLFVLFLAMFWPILLSQEILLSNLFLLVAYRRIYSLRSQKRTIEKLFDSGFWIGVAALIHPWSMLFIILVYSSLNAFNKLTLRNAIIPLIGFVTPIFIYGVYLFAVDQFDDSFLAMVYSFNFSAYNSFGVVVPLALILGMLIWTVIPTTFKIISVNNEFRGSWTILVANLVISIIMIIPSPIKNGSEFLFMFFPVAVIFTNYLQRVNEKWFKEVFLYFFVAVAVTTYFL